MSFASPTISGGENSLRVTYGDDKGLLVEFVEDAIYQEHESNAAGRAIYKNVPFVSIIIPGDKTKRPYRPATQQDKLRFPVQWAAYEKGEKAIANGTPITQWNLLSKAQALELRHLGFHTVELLAEASDTQLGNLMGGTLLRKQAQVFLESSKDGSSITKLVAENEQLKSSVKVLEEQNALFKSRLDALEANSKPKTLTINK